jgi:preprotein translocase subunit SecA
MRIFAGDRVVAMMRAMGLQENEAIEHKMVSRSIENAQRKVEARNFDIRKNLLKYDDVNNEQRKIIYLNVMKFWLKAHYKIISKKCIMK